MIEREPDSLYSRYKLTGHYNSTKVVQVERLQEPGYEGETPIIEMFVIENNRTTAAALMFTLDEAEELALVLQAVINTYKRDGE